MSERVTTVGIETEMRESYLDYAMSVIVARALPDVRDGLKPVQRRILYAMGDMGLSASGAHKKSARVVGEVLGKYHPHGESAVYEAMVRMAQDFSLRYPLVDGQGNFGSVDGDGAAAMRYTEARLSTVAREMLGDIDRSTVDFVTNFDESLHEPSVLPARLPNLLVNGSSGIAVGMATSVPPHNLVEVCDALVYLLDHHERQEAVDTDDLMRFVRGPDFPTGGILYAGNGDAESDASLRRAYASGRGHVTVRARVTTEDGGRGTTRLVVTELPYQTNKARLVERIAELVRAGKIDGVTDLRDESDRDGMRLVIEAGRGVDPRRLLTDLYRLTPMQSTFSIMMLALVNGEPRTLSLKRMLLAYLEHRVEVLRRRAEHDLARARDREHVLAGLLIALANIDEVIATIRRSKSVETARTNLRRKFQLSERQAQAILDMPLRRLAALERQAIEQEHQVCLQTIADLEALLGDPAKVRGAIREEILALKKDYGDARRTQIVQSVACGDILTAADLVPDQEVVVLADGQGRVSRLAWSKRLKLPRGVTRLARAGLRDRMVLVTAEARAVLLPVHELADGASDAGAARPEVGGELAAMLVPPRAAASANGAKGDTGSLLLATAAGKVKRVPLDALSRAGCQVARLDDGDRVIGAVAVEDDDTVHLASSSGQAISFAASDVRVMGLAAGCIAGMKLGEGERLVSLCRQDGSHAVVLNEQGLLKRVSLARWRSQRRGGQGVVMAPVDAKSGPVTGVVCADAEARVVVTGSQGSVAVLEAEQVPVISRAAKGKPIVALKKGEKAAGLAVLAAG